MEKRKYISKMILKPDWIINERHLLDNEYQTYILKAAENKFYKQITKENMEHFYEIVFHYLNLNTIIGKGKLYDPYLKEYDKNKIDTFLTDFKAGFKKQDNANDVNDTNVITKTAKDIFMSILNRYIDLGIQKMGNITPTYKNDHIHVNNSIYPIIHVSHTNVYDIWKIDMALNESFGTIQNINHFEWSDDNKDRILEFKEEYNKDKDEVDKISEYNTIILTLENAFSHKDIAYLIRDVMLLNKLFTGDQTFENNILINLKQIIDKENTFPYTLVKI